MQSPCPARLLDCALGEDALSYKTMPLTLAINGQQRSFASLTPPVTLEQTIAAMNLKGDRIAVEHNGEIVQRARWPETLVSSGDRLEVVHFVGGGACGKMQL